MAGTGKDFRNALRQLRRDPGFTAVAVIMLALGICANSTVFSWINATMLHPIPGAQKTGELVSVMRGAWNISPSPPMSLPDYRDLRAMSHSLSGLLAYHHDWLTLTGGDPHTLAPMIERVVRQIDAKVPLTDVRALYESTQVSALARIQALFATVFALLALALASTGIYGLVAYRTQLRTHEIGIRMALGASRSDVLRLVVSQGLRLTVTGLALGLLVSVLLTRFLRGLLYGVSATDPLTIVCVTALLLAIAVVACLLPALKAIHVDPVAAIREQ